MNEEPVRFGEVHGTQGFLLRAQCQESNVFRSGANKFTNTTKYEFATTHMGGRETLSDTSVTSKMGNLAETTGLEFNILELSRASRVNRAKRFPSNHFPVARVHDSVLQAWNSHS